MQPVVRELATDSADLAPQLSLQIPSIDMEHAYLLRLVHELQQAIHGGAGAAALKRVLSQLTHYAQHHFAHEEQLMLECGFPGLAAHKAEHDEFVARLEGFRSGLVQGLPAVPVKLLVYIKDWLMGHVQGTDSAYCEYFAAHGVT